MSKRKLKNKPSLSPKTLKEFLQGYDSKAITGVMETMHNSLAWEMFSAYLRVRQREFEVASLDMVGHSNRLQESAKASGYAQGMEDVSDKLIPEFIKFVSGFTGVVEQARPEEN